MAINTYTEDWPVATGIYKGTKYSIYPTYKTIGEDKVSRHKYWFVVINEDYKSSLEIDFYERLNLFGINYENEEKIRKGCIEEVISSYISDFDINIRTLEGYDASKYGFSIEHDLAKRFEYPIELIRKNIRQRKIKPVGEDFSNADFDKVLEASSQKYKEERLKDVDYQAYLKALNGKPIIGLGCGSYLGDGLYKGQKYLIYEQTIREDLSDYDSNTTKEKKFVCIMDGFLRKMEDDAYEPNDALFKYKLKEGKNYPELVLNNYVFTIEGLPYYQKDIIDKDIDLDKLFAEDIKKRNKLVKSVISKSIRKGDIIPTGYTDTTIAETN